MSVTVKLNDVVEALDIAMEEHNYYLDKRTGEIILLTSEELQAVEEDELIAEYPDWQQESILKAREVINAPEEFLTLPDQFDVHEYKIMEDFCFALKDRHLRENMLRRIKGSGAFRRFKNAIHELGVDKAWYEFKRAALEEMAIKWLEEHEISYSLDDNINVSETSM